MEFKDRLKKYRADNNLTQEDLANKLCVSRQAVSKYETGLNYPNLSVMTDISRLLGVSLDELLSREEIAKETINANLNRRKNKRTLIILAIVVAVVVAISVTAIVLSVRGSDGVKDNGLQLVGMVGTLTDETPDIQALQDGKLFGYCFTRQGEYMIAQAYNLASSQIELSGMMFTGLDGDKQIPSNATADMYADVRSGCSVYMDVTVSVKTGTCNLYDVYYDKSTDEYIFINEYTVATKETVTVEMDKGNEHWKFVFKFKQVDELQEIMLYEYAMNSELLRSSKLDGNNYYEISKDCLYLVVEERFVDAGGNVYYNRDVVLNSQIDKVLFYKLPKLNENGYGTASLEIRK